MTEPRQEEEAPVPGRRRFLYLFSSGLAALAGLILGLPIVSFFVSPAYRKQKREWRPVGKVDSFKVGETVEVKFLESAPLPWVGQVGTSAAWLRRVDAEEFVVFAINCTHLGCPVRWLAKAELFMCPCHGGVFYKDGAVAAGPPPHPLHRYEVRVVADQVEIRTSPVPL